MSLRIAMLGAVWSTEVALRALAAAGHRPELLLTLPLERSGRHSDFVDLGPLAEQLGVPMVRAADVNAPEVLARLSEARPDVSLVIGWSRLCGDEFRAAARLGTLGYHPTLLPTLRGRAALAWTILLGLERSGGSIFWMDEGVDSGPIAAQQDFALAPDAALADLIELQKEALRTMVPPLFERLAAGEVPAVPQDHEAATYVALRRPADGEIDWNRSAAEIERLVRAVSRPYPGAFTQLHGRRLTIWSARVANHPQWLAQVGQVFTHDQGLPVVRCGGDTDLSLIDWELEPAEKGPPAATALRAQPRLGR